MRPVTMIDFAAVAVAAGLDSMAAEPVGIVVVVDFDIDLAYSAVAETVAVEIVVDDHLILHRKPLQAGGELL
jgi:hypothetical protein